MEIFSSYNIIIEASVILILSFLFNGIAKRTNIPSVLLLIVLGVILQFVLKYMTSEEIDFFPALELLGIIGLIMIVLEAALELELKREKLVPILKSMVLWYYRITWYIPIAPNNQPTMNKVKPDQNGIWKYKI